jgi:hypothetical protein
MLFWLSFDVGGQPKEKKRYIDIYEKKGFVMVIVEKEQTVLGNLHLIWVYDRSHYIHAQFQPSGI